MTQEVRWALIIAFFLCVVGAIIVGLVVAGEVAGASAAREKARSLAARRAAARTSVFSRTELEDLWRQVEEETVLLRQVDPTELPRKVHSGWRRVR